MLDLQRVLDEQGFVVVGNALEFPVGHVIDSIMMSKGGVIGANGIVHVVMVETKVVVIGEATIDEWRKQCLTYGEPWLENYAVEVNIYKVVAE